MKQKFLNNFQLLLLRMSGQELHAFLQSAGLCGLLQSAGESQCPRFLYIFPEEEFYKRIREQERLIREMPAKYPVHFLAGNYDSEKFYAMAKGLEQVPEGGERCFKCYELRLREAAKVAAAGGFDYFTTTLSISPLKNAAKLNEIGERLAAEYQVAYLPSDFKKKNGYKRSTELSREYGLYRQDYCGCIFSKKERMETLQK